MFSSRKAAQIAAFFIDAQGGQQDVLKLVKLIYLADRQALSDFGFPISYDELVAMPHGPVNSQTLDCINGFAKDRDGWDELISDRSNHMVALRRPITRGDLDELSDAEIGVMRAVWNRFGPLDKWALRDFTHDHCHEWRDPHGSSRPIDFSDIFMALGRDRDEAEAMARDIRGHQYIDSVFAGL